MKHTLIAGGAGFIGSHLCEYLLGKGHKITVIDNLVTGQKRNIASLIERGVKFIEADINEDIDIAEPVDQIYNMASPASPTEFDKRPIFILRTGAQGHEHLLQLAMRKNARILFGSTSEVYGDALEHPQRETYFGNVNSVGARSCYDESKRFGEAITMAYVREHGVNACIARIFNTYGPRMRVCDGRIIPNFFTQSLKHEPLTVYGKGEQTRSFCYVSDLVLGLVALMESDHTGPINIGNPTERSVLEMATVINQLTGNSKGVTYLPLPEDDPKQRRPDISKAQQLLSWQPSVSLEEGLKLTHEFFKSEVAFNAPELAHN